MRKTAVAVFVFAAKFLFFRFFVKRGQLPTPYQFFRWRLPPLAALLALGVPVFILNLRWAARRLAALR